jgi:hypothetical protein
MLGIRHHRRLRRRSRDSSLAPRPIGCGSLGGGRGAIAAGRWPWHGSLIFRDASRVQWMGDVPPCGLAFLYEPLIDIGESSVQLRPYVRPVLRHLPLAIMGVRMRVRLQSVGRAQGTRLLPVLPELFLTTAFPITRFSVSCRICRAYARRPPPAPERHAAASVAAATRPFAR